MVTKRVAHANAASWNRPLLERLSQFYPGTVGNPSSCIAYQ
jgi:hypothetical protein